MSSEMTAVTVKEMARSFRADLVGIAPIERFDGQPQDRDPRSIFPECRSVVVIARRVLRGSLRGVEEGTNFHSTYGAFGLDYLNNNFLSKTTYDLTCWIEDQGFEAVPLFGYGTDAKMDFGVPVDAGKPAPNVIVDINVAAQAAGLAELGLGGFLLTPEFGTRQRFALILTDAALEPDAVRKKTLCGDCKACLAACPLQAYGEKTETAGLPDALCAAAELDLSKCQQCRNGARVAAGHGGSVDRLAAICARTCMVQLERKGKVDNAFHNAFRKRQAWAMDSMGQPVDQEKLQSALQVGCDGAGR